MVPLTEAKRLASPCPLQGGCFFATWDCGIGFSRVVMGSATAIDLPGARQASTITILFSNQEGSAGILTGRASMPCSLKRQSKPVPSGYARRVWSVATGQGMAFGASASCLRNFRPKYMPTLLLMPVARRVCLLDVKERAVKFTTVWWVQWHGSAALLPAATRFSPSP